MVAKRIYEISTSPNAAFEKTKISKQLNATRMSVHHVEHLWKPQNCKRLYSFSKTSNYNPRCHQKGLRKLPIPENAKTDTEENFSPHCVQDGRIDWRKSLRRFRTPLLSAKWFKASAEEHPLVEWLETHWNRILIFPIEKHSPMILSSANKMIM